MMLFRFLLILMFFLTGEANAANEGITKNICQEALQKIFKSRNRDAVFYERALKPLVEVADVLKNAKSADEAALLLTQTDFRGSVFRLEDLTRFYEDADWAEDFTKFRDPIKRLEDAIGAAVDASKRPGKARAINLDPDAIKILESDAKARMDALATLLKKDRWMGEESPMLKKFTKAVLDLDVPKQKKTSKYIAKMMNQEGREIIDADFDMHELQTGLHKLRRRLRWFVINIQAHRGQIEIVEDAVVPAKLTKYMNISEESKKFMDFEVTERPLEHTVKMKKSKYYTLSYFVNWLGDIKDRGEIHEFFLDALMRSKKYKTVAQADAYLIPILKEKLNWTDYLAEAEQAKKELLASGVLKNLP